MNISSNDTGSLSFALKWENPQNLNNMSLRAKGEAISELSYAPIDCTAIGVLTVTANVYDSNNAYLINGGPWDCTSHSGTITGVPAGNSRKITVYGKDSSDKIVYRGEATGVTITANQTTNAGSVTMSSVASDTTAPTDGTLSATAGNSQISLSWTNFSDLGGIDYYKLVYSTSSTPSSCSAGTQIYLGSGTSYTHTGLTNSTTYYYRVCATDNAGNTSSGATTSGTPTASGTTTDTTTTPTTTGTTTATGLVGYWKLNGNANDDSGNGYNGTVTGAISTSSGKFDSAYSFDGSGDYIDFGNINNFDRTDSFSISAWVKRGAIGIPHAIVSKRNDSAGTGYVFYIDSANKLDITFGKTYVSDSIRLNSTLTFTDSNWHHFVITYDGSSSASGVKLYADGVQQATNTDWNTLSSSFSNSYAFRIGDVSDGGVGMNGIIDEVRIYNRALSASEISDLYNNP